MSERSPSEMPPGDTEIEARRLAIHDLKERFVLHWGEMASAWGVNRTMGQIHALLYVSPEPLSMDEVIEWLRISRGNASMNLRALEDWGLVRRVHYTGDRREYFHCLTDPWELLRALVRERKRREFDPMMRSLRLFVADAERLAAPDAALETYRERLSGLLNVLELLEQACEHLLPRAPDELPRLLDVEVEGLD